MQNNQRESIWAAGCPQNVKEEFKIKPQELLNMAVNFIVKQYAVDHHFTVKEVSAKLNTLPTVVLEKNGKLYGLAVVPFVYPNFSIIYDKYRIDMVQRMKVHNMTCLFAPVGFRSEDDERAKAGMMLKGDVFHIMFRGFIVMTDDEKQNLMPAPEEFKMDFE